jgi:hypothetical protein
VNKNRFNRLRERWRDPVLTTLTLLLALLMFVLAPLQAAGIAEAQEFGFAIALVVVGGAVFMSGNPIAIVMMLVAIGLAAIAAVLHFTITRLRRSMSISKPAHGS